MHFFDEDERYANGLEWYRKKMPYSFDNQVHTATDTREPSTELGLSFLLHLFAFCIVLKQNSKLICIVIWLWCEE